MDAFYDLCAWTSAPNNAGDNDAGNDSTCVQMAVGSPVGITGIHETGFELQVYPNPVSGELLHLSFTEMDKPQQMELRLYGLAGDLLLQESFPAHAGRTLEIETAQLAKGIYLLEITGEKGRSTHKIIIQ